MFFDNFTHVYDAYGPPSPQLLLPLIPADAPPSLQISSSGSCLFILLSHPLSLTKDVCVTTGLELPDRVLWAQQWAQLKSMIPTLSQNSSEANALAHGLRLCEPLPLKLCFLHEEKVKKNYKALMYTNKKAKLYLKLCPKLYLKLCLLC